MASKLIFTALKGGKVIEIKGNKSLIKKMRDMYYAEEEIEIETTSGKKTVIIKTATRIEDDLYVRLLFNKQHYCGFVFHNKIHSLGKCA
jgi:hypothetical protein